MWQYQQTSELYHYGILGMKWGQRRAIRSVGKYTSKAQKQISASDKVIKKAKKIIHDNYDPLTETKLSSSKKKSYHREIDMYSKSGQNWLKTKNDLLSMDTSKITPKDVRSRFNETRRIPGTYYIYGK